jgi:predicted oxidoreductase (fatty acid repression mutant protein)
MKKEIEELVKSHRAFIESHNKIQESNEGRLRAVEKTVEAKHLPVNLETEILRTAQTSMNEAIKSVLSAYNSPLTKLVALVIDKNTTFLRQIISDSFNQVIRTEEFKASIVSAFSHKVARTIISNNEGLFDKVCNELKQDSQFKAKITLAVANVVEECLKSKS